MLKLIYGVPGSGKTYICDTMILSHLKNGKSVTLLVPEQEVMETERRIADRAENEGVFCEKLTVVSFRRLANLAFRKYGGIEYKNLGDGGRLIVIWRIIEELAPAFKAYKDNRDRALCELMLSVCTELKRYRITPSSLSKTADKLENTPFGDRLFDISLIYTAYLAQMKDEYSDSVDDVERLAEILSEHDFLYDTLLFADSFNGFTANELRVLEYAMQRCELTVTLCRPEENGKIGFSTIEKTEKQLISLAEKHKVTFDTPTIIPSDSPYISSRFRLIEEKLWDLSYFSPTETENPALSLVSCRDRFFEAEYIACRICDLVREGARYRDIAVISRNIEQYEGVYDVVFEKYGIPLFFSHRSKLITTPFYRAISGALDVIIGGFQNEDIISYIKCGCTELNESEINLIESYTALWRIKGSNWTSEYDWNMNPRGFSDKLSSNSAEVLDKINALRKKIREPIIKLRDSLKGSCTVKDGAKAIYIFMDECGCRNKAKNSLKGEAVTVYNALMQLLDTICEVGSDIPANAKVMRELLFMTAKNTDFGRIPESFDCVIAGDASILRASGREHIFLSACEDGVFPRAVSDDSFFSDSDRDILVKNGIELSGNTKEKNDEEMFYFLRAALSASKTLTATYILSNGKPVPSNGFTRLCKLFPQNKVLLYPDDFSNEMRVQTLSTALDTVTTNENDPLYSALREIYRENGIELPPHRIPLSEQINRVSKENTELLFGHKLNMSQSRFEDYAKCPFSYFSKHILALNDQEHSSFRASEIGSYIHKILEKVISYIFPAKGERKKLSDSELKALIEKETNFILSKALGESFVTGRISALIIRLTRTVTLLIKNLIDEFEHSRFSPRFFEMPIGGENSNVAPLKVLTDDGTEISLYGYIDRVDTYIRDGNAYLRVVDYKTGSTEHSLKNISLGIDMQMFLYLFALCHSDNPELKKAIGIQDTGTVLPAGVMYHHSRINPFSCSRPISDEDALAKAESELVRSGVLLKDEEILDAMENGLEGRFVAFKKGKDGISLKKGELKTLEEFGEIASEITSVMKEIGNSIKSGCADASPIQQESLSPCKYCKLKPFCRKTD